MINVGLIDRGGLTLLGLRYLFEEQEDMRIVFAANRPVPLCDTPLDCLVIDLDLVAQLPRMLEGYSGRWPSTRIPRVIGLSAAREPAVTDAQAFSGTGLSAVCRRDDATELLVDAVRRLGDPDGRLEGAAAAEVCLSPREEEVLRHIAAGYTHDQVARRIGISRHTVDTYVKRLRVKLGAGNKAQLVNAAWRMRSAAAGTAVSAAAA